MLIKKLLICLALISGSYLSSDAQTYVPINMDFELGTTANWTYYMGTVDSGYVYTLTTTAPVAGRHEIMSGSDTDYYGGFPEVGIGTYSLKLNHDITGYRADAASYDIAVPGTGSYSLIYQYASVLDDGGHIPAEQAVLEVQAIDSATGTVFFDSIIYPPNPGFSISPLNSEVWYKAWTNVSVDLSAYAGKTVTMKFFAAGCSNGGHYGYAYIDVAGMFETSMMMMMHAPTVTLTAPAGYSAYKWTDAATFGTTYGTTASITIPSPAVKTKYALILTPPGAHGTVDTVYTTVDLPSTLNTGSLAVNSGFSLFPNPTMGVLNIQWANQQAGTATLEVTDVTGRIVNHSVLNITKSGTHQIDLNNAPNGIYFVTIKSDLINYTNKISVQK